MDTFVLTLVDPSLSVYQALCQAFRAFETVEVIHGRFEDIGTFDCIVSPANAFGLLDGGVDEAIKEFFGDALEKRIQKTIFDRYLGEQPVGTSLIVETENPLYPFVAHTPTMRIPMTLTGTDHVYQAMWAMLLAVRAHNLLSDSPIQKVVCPGLGTGTGMMPPAEAAQQMCLAYYYFSFPHQISTWRQAFDRDEKVRNCRDLP